MSDERRKGAAPVSELEQLRNRVAELKSELRDALLYWLRLEKRLTYFEDRFVGERVEERLRELEIYAESGNFAGFPVKRSEPKTAERSDLAGHIAAGRVVVAAPLGEEELDPVVPAAWAVTSESRTVDIFVLDETSADRLHRMLLDLGLVYQPLGPLGDGAFRRFLVSRTDGFTRVTVRFVPRASTQEHPR